MTNPPEPLTAAGALELARARYEQTWTPVPGYPSGDTIGNSYIQEEFPGGWVFRPAIAGIEEDPIKAKTYPYYVVRVDGEVATVQYENGIDTAAAVLAAD